jgi:hypothetical protein
MSSVASACHRPTRVGLSTSDLPQIYVLSALVAAGERVMSIQRATGASTPKDDLIRDHPFVVKLLAHGAIEAEDLRALDRVLDRRVTVKKGQDIIVQGYEYKTLHIVESGLAT